MAMAPADSELIFTRMEEGRLTAGYLIIVTPAEKLIREQISQHGPMQFHQFMRIALYHAEFGYYRRTRDPFGAEGDFYTAEQLQPVFGKLMKRVIGELYHSVRHPGDLTVVELGAGRGEMADALSEFRYVPVDIDRGSMPNRFEGVIFANEFFDSLPVAVFRWTGTEFRERLVGVTADRLDWIEGGAASGRALEYLQRFASGVREGQLVEVNLEAFDWMARIGAALEQGYVLVVDYGYTSAELVRHPSGTLMSYHRHTADENVFAAPGERDITAHVPFTVLEHAAGANGMERVRFETLAATLLRAGESDHFAGIFEGAGEEEQVRLRLQLKSLLFGMGETFRTLLLRKAAK
jgi:SAM-dependent MidA family methyltransferase